MTLWTLGAICWLGFVVTAPLAAGVLAWELLAPRRLSR